MKIKVNKKHLIELGYEIEDKLRARGIQAILSPYFAYGEYGYFFDIYIGENRKQLYTGLYTKRECYFAMYKEYSYILDNIEYYQSEARI